jgi:DNA-cytosine methyltransferase
MIVLSLFDGISCGQIALERAGIKVDKYYASEIDKYAIKVTQNNYPKTIQLGDVTKIKGSGLPKIDLLIGGSPCQGFSFAGKQLNFEDERSKLFFEFVRLLVECKPKYFLLENVKMKKEYQDVITKYLGVEPIKINSSLVSAQNRERLYWTNVPNIVQPKDKSILLRDILEDDVDSKYFMNKPLILNGKNKGHIGDLDYKDNERQRRVYSDDVKSPTLLSRSDSPRILNIGSLDMKASQQIKRVYDVNGLCPTLDTMQGGHRQPKILEDNRVRKLTPLECERLQTVPDNYTEGVSNTQRYKMLGNGWTVDVIAHIFQGITSNLDTK